MKTKGDLSRAERLEIEILLGKGYSLRRIAGALVRSPNTVSYEIRENSTNGRYDALKAHAKARLKKRFRKLQCSKLNENLELQQLVVDKLTAHCNPDEIAGWLKREKRYGYVSKTAIYDWLRTSRGERYCVHLYSKRKRVKKRKPRAEKMLIPNRVSTQARPLGATHRTRFGHWERDTVVSRRGTLGGLATAQERKTRLVAARKVSSMKPAEHLAADRTLFSGVTALSVTRDNGIENRAHETLGIPSFFCDPYSSWQKGGIENANKMLRRYFPKGTDFGAVSQTEIDDAVRMINEKPRKILGYRCSRELAEQAGIIKNESVLIQG